MTSNKERSRPRPTSSARKRTKAEPLGRRLGCGEAAEAAKAGAIVERFGQAHIRKIVPRRQKQRAEQRQWRPASLALCRSQDVRKQPIHLRPVHQCYHLVEG